MKLLSPRLTFASPVLVLALLAGCKSPAPATDESLTAAVQTRLAGDAAIANEGISSSVQNGVATLNGAVSSDAARALAANDAAQVAGIRTVVNNLVVNPPTTAMTSPQPPPSLPPPAPEPRERSRAELSRVRPGPPSVKAGRGTTRAATPTAPPPQIASNPSPAESSPVVPPVSQPSAPAAPVVRNVSVPSGSIIPVRISQTLDSATAQQGQSFSGTVASDVVIEGVTVLRQGSTVAGTVSAVQEAAHFKGSALLAIQLTSVTRRGETVALNTDPYSTEGKGRGKNTAIKTGGGAAVGALLGGIFGGGKGAAIGAGAGGGLGAGANAITRGEQVQIPAESLIRFRLSSPITVRVTGGDARAPENSGASPSPDSGRRPLN